MKTLGFPVLISLAVFMGIGVGPAWSQYGQYPLYPYNRPGLGGPGSLARPPYSPYLNQLRGGTSPAINYYGLVRPQENVNTNLYQLQRQTGLLGQQLLDFQAQPTDYLPITGIRPGFMTQARYFQNQFQVYGGTGYRGPGFAGAGLAGAGHGSGLTGGTGAATSNQPARAPTRPTTTR
jgi:hypothetical protein